MIAPDPVRWFDPLGRCVCGKAATGILRGPQNESYGAHCQRCADVRLKRAEKERERRAAAEKQRERRAILSDPRVIDYLKQKGERS